MTKMEIIIKIIIGVVIALAAYEIYLMVFDRELFCRLRRLTPTECERLQGFPDGWTEGVSDTQRYKCLGNAVTVSVIQAITEMII
jgi:hypothetical protein